MKRTALLTIFVFFTCAGNSQYRVKFTVSALPSAPAYDSTYLAGNFNNWNPGDASFKLSIDAPNHFPQIILHLGPGTYEFKFTRGSWRTVECAIGGGDIKNRIVTIQSDTNLTFSVTSWKDQFMETHRLHSASKNVLILDSAFYIPQLDRYRRIWAYVPGNYATSRKKYGVIYMQDGQNLFDEYTSAFGEWGIDETLDTLPSRYNRFIIVGIDNGGDKRVNEYNPYDDSQFGKGEGIQYVNFLISTLKPFIDSRFRTNPDCRHTLIAGSSLGALISFFAILKHPDIFGGAGIFSPAFWAAPLLYDDTKSQAASAKGKFYFYAGMKESKHMVSDMMQLVELLRANPTARVKVQINRQGTHNEAFWKAAFADFYKWIVL